MRGKPPRGKSRRLWESPSFPDASAHRGPGGGRSRLWAASRASRSKWAEADRPETTQTERRRRKGVWFFLGVWIGAALAAGCLIGCVDWSWADRLAERRAKAAGMSRLQKAHLLQTQMRFQALPPAEQERLRQLNRRIDQDPQAGALRQTAQRYYAWLKTLPMYRRAELQETPPQQRLDAIQRALEEESAQAVRRPRPQDAEALWRWMQQYAQRHEAEVLAALPPDRQHEWQSDPEHRRRLVMSLLWMHGPSASLKIPRPSQKEMEELYRRLSPQTRQHLQAMPPEGQWKRIASWARYLVHYQVDRATGWIPPEVSEAELLHFFEYELSPEQIDVLLALPADQMLQELRRLYFRVKIPGWEGESPEETALPLGP